MTLEALNAFCVGFGKLTELYNSGRANTDEAFEVIRNMRYNWNLMDGKEAHYIERFTVKLADMGYFKDIPSPPKVDISDLEFDDNTDVKGEFKYTSKITKPGATYATYNYNEHSVPITRLPINVRTEIFNKSIKNAESTERAIVDPESARYNQKRNHLGPKLADSERDW